MHVLQILHQGGGAGSVFSTLHLSIRLARAGLAVRFVCPPGSEVEEAARNAGLEVHPLALRPRSRRANARAIAELLERHPVDLVNSQSSRDRQAFTWLGLTGRLKVPVIFTRRQMPLTIWLENWAASRVASRVIAVSHAVAEALVRRGTPREKVVAVHNGLVPDRVDRPVAAADVALWRERIGWNPEQRVVGIMSRLKDQAVVLRALHQVEVPVRLVMAGVARDEGRLDELARALPPRHSAVFIPFEPANRPLYELMEVMLLPTRMEGLSQALLEGMALGKPSIASAASGNLEVITDGVDGRLVSATDPAAWAQALTEVLTSEDLARRMGDAARHTARERFSLDRTVERTIGV
ncbi:MAG: glycosyltransferase family 4 protein [Gemmatimonadales bacterium]